MEEIFISKKKWTTCLIDKENLTYLKKFGKSANEAISNLRREAETTEIGKIKRQIKRIEEFLSRYSNGIF